ASRTSGPGLRRPSAAGARGLEAVRRHRAPRARSAGRCPPGGAQRPRPGNRSAPGSPESGGIVAGRGDGRPFRGSRCTGPSRLVAVRPEGNAAARSTATRPALPDRTRFRSSLLRNRIDRQLRGSRAAGASLLSPCGNSATFGAVIDAAARRWERERTMPIQDQAGVRPLEAPDELDEARLEAVGYIFHGTIPLEDG